CCAACGARNNEVGLQRDEFHREAPNRLRIGGCRPANVDPSVAALCPPELLESVQERRDQRLPRTTLIAHQHPNPPHPLWLLRPRRERPRGCRAAEQRDERAPFHCPMPPVLPTGRIARLRTAGDCCIHPTLGGTR